MAWRHPQRIFEDGQVINDRDLLEALRPVIEELQGQINEHNISSDIQAELTQADLPADTPWRWTRTGTTAPDASIDMFNYDASPPQPGAARLPFSVIWRSAGYSDIITLEEGCLVRMIGGCLFWFEDSRAAYTGGTFVNKTEVWWGLRINGSVYPDTIWGSQDYSEEGDNKEVGYSGTGGSPKVDSLMRLPAGTHTVELVYRTTEAPTAVATPGRSTYMNVGNVDLVIIAMER